MLEDCVRQTPDVWKLRTSFISSEVFLQSLVQQVNTSYETVAPKDVFCRLASMWMILCTLSWCNTPMQNNYANMDLRHYHAFSIIKILFLSINLDNLNHKIFLRQIMVHIFGGSIYVYWNTKKYIQLYNRCYTYYIIYNETLDINHKVGQNGQQ